MVGINKKLNLNSLYTYTKILCLIIADWSSEAQFYIQIQKEVNDYTSFVFENFETEWRMHKLAK